MYDPSPLEMEAETFYHLGMLAVEIATEYLEGIPQRPVYRPMTPSERQLLLYQQLPEHGRSPEALFDFFERDLLINDFTPLGSPNWQTLGIQTG